MIKEVSLLRVFNEGIVLEDPVDVPFPGFQYRRQGHLRGTWGLSCLYSEEEAKDFTVDLSHKSISELVMLLQKLNCPKKFQLECQEII